MQGFPRQVKATPTDSESLSLVPLPWKVDSETGLPHFAYDTTVDPEPIPQFRLDFRRCCDNPFIRGFERAPGAAESLELQRVDEIARTIIERTFESKDRE
jgi:hypothetical protein